MPGRASPPPRSHGLHLLYRTWNLQNRWEKFVFLVYAPSLEALFAILCSTACILHDIFTFSQCSRHHFAEKWTLLSEVTSHKYVKANTASRICRTGVAMISLSWSRRLWTAYCLQYDMSYMCRHDVFILESPFLNCTLHARWYVVYMSPWCLHLGVADFELHVFFRRPETALPIKNKRAAVLPSPEGLQYKPNLTGATAVA